MTEWRATPLDPHPQAPRHQGDDGTPRATDLGPDAIAILDGRTFMFTDSLGDAPLAFGTDSARELDDVIVHVDGDVLWVEPPMLPQPIANE